MKYNAMKITYKLVLSALFLDVGLILPFLTGQIQQVGNMLLPMHLPVFLCAFVCGWQYGGMVGLILPIMRSFIFGMPVMYPNAIAMALELAVYGLVAGLIYEMLKKRTIVTVYASMIPAMLMGRIIWGIAQIILLGVAGNSFTWQMFIAGAFLNAIPGIILQLILIPVLMSMLHLIKRSRMRKVENG